MVSMPQSHTAIISRMSSPIIKPITPADAIALNNASDDERRDDRRAAPERVADAVGAQPHLGREQLRCVNAEEDRDLN